MKKFILIVLCLTGLNAVAEIAPGDGVTQDLSCGEIRNKVSGELILGASYSMECTLQALPPEYSLVGCALYSKAVYPGAIPEKIEIRMKIQTIESAYFENTAQRISILVEKEHLKATVVFDEKSEMQCSVGQQAN